MEKFKTIALIVLSIVLVVVSCLFIHQSLIKTVYPVESTVKTDTLYVHDTIEIEVKKDSIVYVNRKVVDTLYLPTPKDTTPLQIEQKHYKDTLADIYISGFKPMVDSVHYHIPTKTIYVDRVVEKQQKDPWHKNRFVITLGVYGGYGLIYKQPDIFVGIGMGFRLY